ncbi:MAG TPA: DUF4134 domain-containing protein [Puia sp.]|nr:DUF4134 domain-containing protein [Puia sp.]
MRKSRVMPAWAWGAPGRRGVFIVLGLLGSVAGWAQTADGGTGIDQANTMVRSYFDPAVNLMYAIGAVVGIAGAVKVYQKMSHNHPDTERIAMGWFGACIFLVVVATVLKAFFGL